MWLASFPSDDPIGYSRELLAFAPINNADSLSAAAHLEFASFMFVLYGKSWENVVALIGDNFSTNVAFARLAGVPLAGCASHLFNLFVSDLLSNHDVVIQKVNILMRKLRNILPASCLRRLTPLWAKTLNATRWTSAFCMLTPYSAIKTFIGHMGDNDIDMLRLSPVEERKVDALLVVLGDLNSITLALQNEECTVFDVRRIFDTVVEDYPDAARRLGETADIVHYPGFESGVVKILRGNEEGMSATEVRDVQPLASSAAQPILPLSQRALKKQRVGRVVGGDMDCRFVRPTSNMCERFFFVTKLVIGDHRCSITPKNFEEQTSLRANSHLWGVEDVHETMRSFE
ncbi:hypothetical protein DYB28_011580 [Aphanomyces astaci]|uniref:DUF659 domain-containing protein n=1 Tax=Aphanomyces astaci TaxID=112090 RepID=A0A9X8HA89_APHAT|nr:hypothetical protein DYB28_011580 [Aphanomyces astaci]